MVNVCINIAYLCVILYIEYAMERILKMNEKKSS